MKLVKGLLLKPTLQWLNWLLKHQGNSLILGGPMGWTWQNTIDDSHHGSRGAGLHADSHNRQHDHSLSADGSPIALEGVPNLPANKITSGTFSLDRIPTPLTGKDADTVDGQHRILTINADHTHQSSGAQGGTLATAAIASGRFGMARMPDGVSGYVLTAKGSGINPAYEPASGGEVTFTRYTSSGTWTKPTGCKWVYVEAIGGGGGGASVSGNGGGGGGGGARQCLLIHANALGGTETVTVGAGGAGGTGGANGTAGGTSSFGTKVIARGGAGGNHTSGGDGGAVGNYARTSSTGGLSGQGGAGRLGSSAGAGYAAEFGGGGGGSGNAVPGGAGGVSLFGAGGGGGAAFSTNTGGAGGFSGINASSASGGGGAGGAPGNPGGDGANAVDDSVCGAGGGGAGGGSPGRNGGNGGIPGGGGGGGGHGDPPGAGGNGGRGEVRVWSW